ncbi:MAG: PaaI family thioesterase [Blastomonas sp.]
MSGTDVSTAILPADTGALDRPLSSDEGDFDCTSDPARPGWLRWTLKDTGRFNSVLGPMWARKAEDGMVHVLTEPGYLQGNLSNNLHGGMILTQIDIALFVCARLNGSLGEGPGVTLDLSTHFYGAGKVGVPTICEVEILRETGRFIFERGLVTQNGESICAFTGTIRKSSVPRR